MASAPTASGMLRMDGLAARLASPGRVAEGQLGTLLGLLWLTGGFAAGAAWFSGVFDDGRSENVLAICVVAVVVGGALLALGSRPVSQPANIALTLLGALAISLAVWWSGPVGATALGVLYVYVGAFAFVALPRHAPMLVLVSAALHGGALLHIGFSLALGVWLLTWVAVIVTGMIAGGAVDWLRRSVLLLQDVDEHKTRFIATVTHELRTPLTAILGFTETLEHRWDDLDDGDRRHFVAVIDRQATRQLRLVNDVLAMTVMMTGAAPPARQNVELTHLLALTLESLPFDVELDVPSGLAVTADPAHLQQVLENLLVNADRYGAPPITVRARNDDHVVTVDVVDHGRGLPEGFDALLEPFVQGDSGDTRVSRGVGLGLAICRDLVEANGGRLEHVDTPGGGTTIRLHLPGALETVRPPNGAVSDEL